MYTSNPKLMAIAVAGILLSACDEVSSTDPVINKVPVVPEVKIELVSGSVDGVLRCDPLDSWASFSRKYDLVINQGVVSLDEASNSDVPENWTGTVSETTGAFNVTGVYGEGNKARDVKLNGELDGTTLTASGNRGPRTCAYEGQFTSTATQEQP